MEAADPSTSDRSDEPARRAHAHSARGAELAGRRRFPEAIAEFREALRRLPDNAVAWSNLAMTLAQAGCLDGDEPMLAEAVEGLRTAVRLQPGAVALHQRLAAVLAVADRVPEALAVLNEALRLDPDNGRTRALRSVAQLTLGDFEGGWLDFDGRLDNPSLRAQELPGVPRWRGERLSGTLLINGLVEGQGDCLFGIRYAAEARRRVGSTILLCPPSLARLLGRCPGVDRVATSRDGLPAVQAQVAALHLASAFRPTRETLWPGGYLSPEPAAVGRWRPAIGGLPGLKIGIAWQGNPAQSLDPNRSFRLADLEPVARVAGVSLVSLQKGHGVEQIARTPFSVIDLGPEYAAGDWLETAAVLSHLDLVIAPDTAIAHLAGGLGRPTWLALSRPADWRWMIGREDSPWYPTIRLFRQDRLGDWGPVFLRMAEALRERAAGRGEAPPPR
jgi:hypothetical protein